MLTVGSLFAGIGGFDLGLERTGGFQVKWQVEIDPYCLKVLEKHWPHVKRYTDIKQVDWSGVEPVDLVCGGFPCQPVSVAGKRKGTSDDRWLWPEFVRCVGVLRPRYVLIENVPGLLTANDGLAFAEVLRDVAASGYSAEWDCIPASAVSAPHTRDRFWLVAYSNQATFSAQDSQWRKRIFDDRPEIWNISLAEGETIPDSSETNDASEDTTDWASLEFRKRSSRSRRTFYGTAWEPEPELCRVVDGVPTKLYEARNGQLGNAVVPQVVEWIGRQILKAEA